MKIALQLSWNPAEVGAFVAAARQADEVGVHSLWLNEGFGHDAFSGLAILARETRDVLLGTAIVNVYSRTPGALTQHFATIDQLSHGRVVIGLGASAPGAVERFHGLPFHAPRRRLQEAADLIRRYWAGRRFSYEGEIFRIERALPLGVSPVRATPPIFFAALAPRSVRLTAQQADGWLPAWIPTDQIAMHVRRLRQWAAQAGRDPAAILVRSPATTVVATDSEAVAVRQRLAEQLAFFVCRNGEFYYRQFVRAGLGDAADSMRRAWDERGPAAAAAAVSPGLVRRFGFVGDLSACREQLHRQQEAGIDIHLVALAGIEGRDATETLAALSRE
jgi:alkanesulfonate monooxygenase SsuD/methylene tetrahydromethanopterin reductase-like flavin-dependent oxidoreductase (luciferase family)